MYYVKVMTRSSGARRQGSPRHAIDYITDGHDLRRDPGYSDAELAYIARAGDGWKTELEGGRVPLVGAGVLTDITDEAELAARFEGACQPWHDRRATTGYKSFTLTVPKELSLYAEGHREATKRALHAAMRDALNAAFPGKDFSAVAAVHTRNEAGEVHYHVHVLVAKFARDRESGAVRSLNSKAGGNTGKRMHDLKTAWKAAVDHHVARELGVQIEQGQNFARPTLVLPDGRRLAPLNRDGRRALDKHLSDKCRERLGGGQFRLNDKMDGRVFELAAAPAGWSRAAFIEHFPEQARFVERFEKRVETLRRVGYMTPEGRVTPSFRLHFCARNGIDTPELQRLRLDVASASSRESRRARAPISVPSLWQAVDRYDWVRKRTERLGLSRDDLRRIHEQAHRLKPTAENLRAVRQALLDQETRAAKNLAAPKKTVLRAFCAVQHARVRAVFLVTTGAVLLRWRDNKRLADTLVRNARRDLFQSKQRRMAQIGRRFRPVFWATRVIMPATTRKLERALSQCSQVAARQRALGLYKEYERQAYLAWSNGNRALLEQPKVRPSNDFDAGAAKVAKADLVRSAAQLQAGMDVIVDCEPHRDDTRRFVQRWKGRETELVSAVVAMSRGDASSLRRDDYDAAVRAGRIGHLLDRERSFRAPKYPQPLAPLSVDLARASARLRAHGASDPFTAAIVGSMPSRTLERALGFLRDAKLLQDGAGWTANAKDARRLGQQLSQAIDEQMRRNKTATR